MMETKIQSVPVSKLVEHERVGMVPTMTDDEWNEFLESVKEKGIQVPIAALKDGRVLDGRHRLKAARELGIQTVDVIYHDFDEIGAIEFIRDTATKRRNLTAGQKAAIVLEAEDLCKKIEETSRQKQLSGLKHVNKAIVQAHGPERGRINPTLDEKAIVHVQGRERRQTRDKLGEIAGVSGKTIDRVKKVKENDPELYDAIKENKISARKAYEKYMEKQQKKQKQQVNVTESIERSNTDRQNNFINNVKRGDEIPDGDHGPHREKLEQTNEALGEMDGVHPIREREKESLDRKGNEPPEHVHGRDRGRSEKIGEMADTSGKAIENTKKESPKRPVQSIKGMQEEPLSEEEEKRQWLESQVLTLANHLNQLTMFLERTDNLDEVVELGFYENEDFFLKSIVTLETVIAALKRKTKIRRIK